MAQLRYLIASLALALVAAPLAAASPANPVPHPYAGVAAGLSYVVLDGDNYHLESTVGASVLGICADITPLFTTIIPPELGQDGMPETGVGGACFPFKTDFGDDTGTVRTVTVQELVRTGVVSPVWFACVDVNGNGLCSEAVDQFNLCTIKAGVFWSLTNNVAGCQIYANPAAEIPVIYTAMVAAAGTNADGTLTGASVAGFFVLL